VVNERFRVVAPALLLLILPIQSQLDQKAHSVTIPSRCFAFSSHGMALPSPTSRQESNKRP